MQLVELGGQIINQFRRVCPPCSGAVDSQQRPIPRLDETLEQRSECPPVEEGLLPKHPVTVVELVIGILPQPHAGKGGSQDCSSVGHSLAQKLTKHFLHQGGGDGPSAPQADVYDVGGVLVIAREVCRKLSEH